MAYTAPTAADIKARFPDFEDVSDDLINELINEAKRSVDETWLESDYATAIKYLTAHLLVTEGAAGDGSAASSPGPVKSESLGDASVSYGTRTGGTASLVDADLATTVWGTRFLNLRRANFAGPSVV